MNSKSMQDEVKSPQTNKKEEFYGNGYNKYNNTVISLWFGSIFCNWSISKCITRDIFFRLLPPVRFYLNATKGIQKLQALDLPVFDDKGNRVDQKQGGLKRGEIGFDELARLIKENTSVVGEIRTIILVEDEAGVGIGDSSKIVRLLYLDKGESNEHLTYDPFDPDKPIRDLRSWVDDKYRESLANWMIYAIVIWLIANSLMLYLLNIS